MHMINDKGDAVYFNYVRKNNKDYWVVKGIGPTVTSLDTSALTHVSAAKAATSPRSSRLSATLPGMVSGPIDRHFSGGKNNKGEHQHERITH